MKNRLFNIERIHSSERSFLYRAEIIAGHAIFEGHFPDSPVVPGVCSMSMVKDCLSDALSRPVRYSFIKECKFLSAIVPEQHKALEITITIVDDSMEDLHIAAEIAAAGTKMMKLKATLV